MKMMDVDVAVLQETKFTNTDFFDEAMGGVRCTNGRCGEQQLWGNCAVGKG